MDLKDLEYNSGNRKIPFHQQGCKRTLSFTALPEQQTKISGKGTRNPDFPAHVYRDHSHRLR